MSAKIPGHLIVREIEEYIADDDDKTAQIARIGLFERANVDESAFENWKSKGYAIRFDTAEKLMAAMGKSHLWYADPELNLHYRMIDLDAIDARAQKSREIAAKKAEQQRLWNEGYRPVECRWCHNEFQRPKHSRSEHCSDECRDDAGRDRQKLYARQVRLQRAA